MSREHDGTKGRIALGAGLDASLFLSEVEPLQILSLDHLSKTYRDPMTLKRFSAVSDVSLTLKRGEIFGLLGPNGAGKTSTIKMILGLTRPTAGAVLLDGRDPDDPLARRRLGYLPENPCFYDHLTATEYLDLVGALFGIRSDARRRRAAALLTRLGLAGHAKKPLRKFSKGMTQRLGICQALLNEPNLLVLDEPMSGLDPVGRAEVKQILREERDRGSTVLMSSHVLAETETLCDRVGILKDGRLVEVGPVKGLLSSGILEWEITVVALPPPCAASFRARGHRVDAVGGRWVVCVGDPAALQDVLRDLSQERVFVHSVEPRRESLEDHFMRTLEGQKETGA